MKKLQIQYEQLRATYDDVLQNTTDSLRPEQQIMVTK